MNEQAFDKKDAHMENQDNLSQNDTNNEAMEDAIANELNTDDSVAGTQKLGTEVSSDDQMQQLKDQADEAKDKYLRLVAEFENFRKRNAKERMELIQTAGKDVLQSLLVILDDSERAEKQIETAADMQAVKEGVSLVFGKLRSTLQQKGLRKMECMNMPFDPELHEAITEIPAPAPDMAGKIMDVVEPGYYLNDKLIRYAKVVVGK